MSNVKLNPYIFFQGDCRDAMEFYKRIFGGELTIQTLGEAPKEAQSEAVNPDPNQVMHASLSGGLVDLMGSDSGKASKKAAKIELSLSGTDEAKLRQVYDSLVQGGKATMPLSKQFWGDTFGMVTDKYGVDWMVNISAPPK